MVPVEVLEGVMGRSFSAFFPWKLAKVDGDVPMETKDEGRVVSVGDNRIMLPKRILFA